MFVLNFKTLTFLFAFIAFMPTLSLAQKPIIVPAPKVIQAAPFKQDQLIIQKQDGEEIPLSIELALTPAQQAKGLMFRTEMADNQGMLFVFQNEGPRSFWMKNTFIPLDMIFIKRNGEVLSIHENAIPHDLTPVKSKGNAYAVLEVNAGLSAKWGLQAGDNLRHSAFSVMVLK